MLGAAALGQTGVVLCVPFIKQVRNERFGSD
jgi:hypothetical protein